MDGSWAPLALEEDPQGRGIGALRVEAEAGGGGGGRREGDGRGGGGGGGGGGKGVLNSENNGRTHWYYSLIGRTS